MSDTCIFPDCNEPAHSMFWQGKTYCADHYFKLMKDEFFTFFDQWVDGDPPERLKYLLGRLYQERGYENILLIKGEEEIESYLSSARIRDRGFNFKKIENGTQFSITRHLNAWEGVGRKESVVQTWIINVVDETAELIEQRNWKKGDPDL